jgi:hypothetical protein
MTLDRLTLSRFEVSQWYKKSLVVSPKRTVSAPPETPLRYLGENGRHILLLVRDPAAVYLEEKSFQFLVTILDACKLSMADVALVNTAGTGSRSPSSIAGELGSRVVLFFGMSQAEMGLPLSLSDYQVQLHENRTYLGADALSVIVQDRAQKGLLWGSLKQLFQLS